MNRIEINPFCELVGHWMLLLASHGNPKSLPGEQRTNAETLSSLGRDRY
jgi:hypothetical protein